MTGVVNLLEIDVWGAVRQYWWVIVFVIPPMALMAQRAASAVGGQQYGISSFVGLNGHGKTLGMCELMAVPALRAGVHVVANFRLYPDQVGADPDLWIPLRSWRDITRCGVHMWGLDGADPASDAWEAQYLAPWGHLLATGEYAEVPRLNADGTLYSITDNRRCVLLLDEINAVLPSRGYSSVPPELLRVINQLRKHDVVVGWTAPAWERADKALREVTQSVWLCRGYLIDRFERQQGRKFFPRKARDENGRALRWTSGWPPRRVFRLNCYDAADFEEFSLDATKQRRIGAKGSMWYWRSRHDAQNVYGSGQGVMLLDHIDSFTGVCASCDGTRSRHKCNCATTKKDTGRSDGATAPSAGVLQEIGVLG